MIVDFIASWNWFDWTVGVWVSFYFVLMWFLVLGLTRLKRSVTMTDDQCMPVTVLVSARNEEQDLPRCLDSIMALDYPKDKMQVVLVNDFSTDATGDIMERVARDHANVVVLHSADLPPNGLEAKARGIDHGFTRATGEWVIITDADATVHPLWARHTLGRVTPETGMAGGSLVVRADSWLGVIERVSWGFVQMFNMGMAGWGVPFICLGPNMAIRRSVYVEAGGLPNVHFKVAEDLALFQMVADRKMKVDCYMDEETTATLSPVPSLTHLVSQQRRWLGGGIAHGWLYMIILFFTFWWGFGVIMYLFLGWMISWQAWLTFAVGKAFTESFFFVQQRRRMNLDKHVRYVWVLELYHLFIIILLPPSFLFTRKIKWMGVGYTINYD